MGTVRRNVVRRQRIASAWTGVTYPGLSAGSVTSANAGSHRGRSVPLPQRAAKGPSDPQPQMKPAGGDGAKVRRGPRARWPTARPRAQLCGGTGRRCRGRRRCRPRGRRLAPDAGHRGGTIASGTRQRRPIGCSAELLGGRARARDLPSTGGSGYPAEPERLADMGHIRGSDPARCHLLVVGALSGASVSPLSMYVWPPRLTEGGPQSKRSGDAQPILAAIPSTVVSCASGVRPSTSSAPAPSWFTQVPSLRSASSWHPTRPTSMWRTLLPPSASPARSGSTCRFHWESFGSTTSRLGTSPSTPCSRRRCSSRWHRRSARLVSTVHKSVESRPPTHDGAISTTLLLDATGTRRSTS